MTKKNDLKLVSHYAFEIEEITSWRLEFIRMKWIQIKII